MKTIHDHLQRLDAQYSPELCLIRETLHSPGYHTTLRGDCVVHPTRSSMEYALLLLDSNDPDRLERAGDIIGKIVSLQDVEPTNATYGIWSWFYEEPLSQMAPPDWNWADFIGGRLAQAIVTHGQRLPGDLRDAIRTALRHAAYSIFRRNVQPGYTNIAIMGAMVTAAAGEILQDPFLLDYARRRLNNIGAALREHGGFQEYNSPTYTMVVIEETDRLLQVVKDADCRAAAEALRHHAWQAVAESFHPPTGQWAGPHARAYADRLSPHTLATLSAATGIALGGVEQSAGRLTPPVLPCPASLIERFRQLPQPTFEHQRRFTKRPGGDVIGTTWFDRDACLASVNRSHTWTQARPLIGYLRTHADPAVVLRMKVLWNDTEFTALYAHQAQKGPRVLSALHTSFDTGSFHPLLGKPDQSLYPTRDLRIRYELIGDGVDVKAMENHRFALSADPYQVIVHLPPAMFNGRWMDVTPQRLDDRAVVDTVLHHGSEQVLDFKTARLQFAAALELLIAGEPPTPESPRVVVDQERLNVSWCGLAVSGPIDSQLFSW